VYHISLSVVFVLYRYTELVRRQILYCSSQTFQQKVVVPKLEDSMKEGRKEEGINKLTAFFSRSDQKSQ